MKKRILSMVLAIAMVMSLFAGISITASAAEGTYVLADSIAAGDTVIMTNVGGTKVFTEVNTSKNIGDQADATPAGNSLESAEAAVLTVVAGSAEGSVAFQQADGTYLGWTSGNNLYALAEVNDNSSWTVEITDGAAVVTCVADSARILQYNTGSPRFCAYKGTQKAVSFYKLATGDFCTHENATSEVTTPAKCTEDGVVTYTCSCGETWTEVIKALGHSNDEGTVTVPAGCTTEGTMTYTCTVCGSTKEETIPALGHSYEDGVCTVCGEGQAPITYFKAINLENITEGKYLIGAVRGETYPNVYIATAKISSGDISTTENYVTVVDEFINSADLADNALVMTFTGNNTDGFTISYEAEGETLYLGVSDYSVSRKLAWSADYASVLWTVGAIEKGGYYLSTAIPDSEVRYTVSQNSTNTSPIRGYYNGKLYTGIYLFVEDTFCAHENTSEIAAVEATCTTDGNTAGIVCDDCGAILEGNEIVPATGHDYAVTLTDGKLSLVCACGDTQDVTLNTIAEAKAYENNTDEYNLKGVVTYISGTTVYIQDENDGLCIYFAKDVDTSALELGDEIFVSGTMTVYKELLELNNPTSYVVISKGNDLPVASVTLADLAADTTNAYLGERVTVEGLKVGTINATGATTLTDAEGNTISLFKAAGLADIAQEGDTITVTAIVSTYNGYQLIVNPGTIATDVVVTASGEPEPIVPVTIAEAKAGTAGQYYMVQGVVTAMSADKRTIYIQDATAGIALYLSAKPAEAVCAIGDQVQAYGAWKAFSGLIELDGIDASNPEFFQILTSDNAVEAQIVDIATLMADATNEYLAEKVRIENATITEIASNGSVTLTQGEATIKIYKAPALTEDCVVGAIVNVTAVVSTYNGYQLLINEATDVEVVPPKAPILDESLMILHSLNLASDISVSFVAYAAQLNAYDSFYLECKLATYTDGVVSGYKTVEIEPVANGSAYYYFTLTGITAVMMNDTIEATMHMTKEGEEYISNVDVYSVATYAYAQLDKANAADKLKALCAELLRYGANAQIFKGYRTDALVDAKMTEAHRAYLSDLEGVAFEEIKTNLTDCANATVSFYANSLSLDSKVTVNYIINVQKYTGNAEELTLKITYINVKGEEVTVTLANPTNYYQGLLYSFTFDALLASELRTVLNAAVYAGDTQVSNTNQYSVQTYGVGKTGTLGTLCQSLIAYSDTALAFFAG